MPEVEKPKVEKRARTFLGELTYDRLDLIFNKFEPNNIAQGFEQYADRHFLNNLEPIISYARDKNILPHQLQIIAGGLIAVAIKNRYDWEKCLEEIAALVPEFDIVDIFANALICSLKIGTSADLIQNRILAGFNNHKLSELWISVLKIFNQAGELSPDNVSYLTSKIMGTENIDGLEILAHTLLDEAEIRMMQNVDGLADNFKPPILYTIITHLDKKAQLEIFVLAIEQAIKLGKGSKLIRLILDSAPKELKIQEILTNVVAFAVLDKVDCDLVRNSLNDIDEAHHILYNIFTICERNVIENEIGVLWIRQFIYSAPESQRFSDEHKIARILSIAAHNRLNREEVASLIMPNFNVMEIFAKAIALIGNNERKLGNIFQIIPTDINKVELLARALCYEQLLKPKSSIVAHIIQSNFYNIGFGEIFQSAAKIYSSTDLGQCGLLNICIAGIFYLAKENKFDSIGFILNQINFGEDIDARPSILADTFMALVEKDEKHKIDRVVNSLEYVLTHKSDLSLALAYTFWNSENPDSSLLCNIGKVAEGVFKGLLYKNINLKNDFSLSDLKDVTDVFAGAIYHILSQKNDKKEGLEAEEMAKITRECVSVLLKTFSDKVSAEAFSNLTKKITDKLTEAKKSELSSCIQGMNSSKTANKTPDTFPRVGTPTVNLSQVINNEARY